MSAPPGAAPEPLLSADFVRRLERLEIVSRRIFVGRIRGERPSRRRGESVEFADFRPYAVGDDLRFLDWNVYARLERLVVKLFQEQEDLNVALLPDVSRSMDWGDPHKGLYAKRVAAALAYVGLVRYDRVSVYPWADRVRDERVGLRGRRAVAEVIDLLERLPLEGRSDFTAVARHFAVRHRGRGVVVVISDFLDKGGFADGLRYLRARDADLYAIHVLSPQEIDPPLAGDLRLRDVEDGQVAEVSISRPLLDRYRRRLAEYCTALKDYCVRRGVTYVFAPTTVPFDTLVLTWLRQRGLLR